MTGLSFSPWTHPWSQASHFLFPPRAPFCPAETPHGHEEMSQVKHHVQPCHRFPGSIRWAQGIHNNDFVHTGRTDQWSGPCRGVGGCRLQMVIPSRFSVAGEASLAVSDSGLRKCYEGRPRGELLQVYEKESRAWICWVFGPRERPLFAFVAVSLLHLICLLADQLSQLLWWVWQEILAPTAPSCAATRGCFPLSF